MSVKKPKERERYYLLPGQGGRSFRKKQLMILGWSTAAALFFGTILAVLIWWFSRPMH